MACNKPKFALICIAGWAMLSVPSASQAQQRYTPSTPTVSPYLNLFQNNRNGGPVSRALPNYYSLVRPQLQQNRINNNQQQLIQQQNTVIDQLQQNVQVLQQQQPGSVVTGHNSWFLNTSRYYAQAGSAGIGQQPGRTASAPTAQISRSSPPPSRRR